jgi:hypothetical protein
MSSDMKPGMKNFPHLTLLSKLILIAMLVLCLANALLHDPYVGYDVDDHIAYIKSLAQARLPDIEDSDEFFSPPLPYIIPALFYGVFNLSIFLTLKLAQLINVLLALGSALAVVRICNRVLAGNHHCQNLTLISLLSLPVFYKTHAFVRAEPYLVFFILLYVEQCINLWKARVSPARFSLYSGGLFGAALLSRQWGILILPAVLLFVFLLLRVQRECRTRLFIAFTVSGLVAFLISGWFYISLLVRFGSLTTFNREPTGHFSLKNKAASFYIGRGNGRLFSDPIRDSFDNQLFPIFYTETWGDYWQYYLVYGKDLRTLDPIQGDRLFRALQEDIMPTWLQTNRHEIAQYLGRVNLISMIPTGFALLCFGWGFMISIKSIFNQDRYADALHVPLFTTIILSTLLGYLWFLIQYPSPDGDTIKSTYVLQIFPFIALLMGLFGAQISRDKHWIYPAIFGLILLIFLHNLGSVITHYFSFARGVP